MRIIYNAIPEASQRLSGPLRQRLRGEDPGQTIDDSGTDHV